MSNMWNNIFFCSLLQYLLLLEYYIRVFELQPIACATWRHEPDLDLIEVSGTPSLTERVCDYSLTDGCGSRTSAFLCTVLIRVFWRLCICVCIHMHRSVCTPDLVKDVPTSFITKASVSYKKKLNGESERWQWHILEWTPKVGWYGGISVIV